MGNAREEAANSPDIVGRSTSSSPDSFHSFPEPTRTVTLFGRIPPEALTYWLLNFGAHGPYEVTHAFGPYWSAFSKDASIRASLPPRLLSIAAGVKNEPAGNRADDQAMHFEMVFAYIMTDRFAKALNAFVQGHPQLKEKIERMCSEAEAISKPWHPRLFWRYWGRADDHSLFKVVAKYSHDHRCWSRILGFESPHPLVMPMYGLWRQIRALLGPEICQLIYNNDWRMLEADKSCRDLLAQLMTYAPKMHDSMIKALDRDEAARRGTPSYSTDSGSTDNVLVPPVFEFDRRKRDISAGFDSSFAPFLIEMPTRHWETAGVWKQFRRSWRHSRTAPHVLRILKVVCTAAVTKRYDDYVSAISNGHRRQTRSKNGGNERLRWHGTTRTCRLGDPSAPLLFCQSQSCSLCLILKSGFDVAKAFSRTHYGRYGAGIYTTATSSKANDYVRPNWRKTRVMLLSQVAVGRPAMMQRGNPDLRAPPLGYDSVVGKPGLELTYDELVVYNNAAIKPAYVVVFDRNNATPSGGCCCSNSLTCVSSSPCVRSKGRRQRPRSSRSKKGSGSKVVAMVSKIWKKTRARMPWAKKKEKAVWQAPCYRRYAEKRKRRGR